MIKSIFYKEWLKTRWFILASLILGVGTIAYMFIGVNSDMVNIGGGSSYVYEASRNRIRDYTLAFMDIPFVIALLIGLSQFVPEVLSKRIKLSLHLPMKETLLLYSMILFGLVSMLCLMLTFMGLFFTLDAYFMTSEMHVNAINVFIPWIMGGLTAYFFIAMIAMEPRWLYRFFYAIFVYYVLDLFTLRGDQSGMYPLLISIMAIASMSVIYTANRFKIGEN